MSQLNRVLLIGTVARAANLKWVREKFAVATIALRIADAFRAREGKEQRRDPCFEIVAFGAMATAWAALIKVGQELMVQGRLRMEVRHERDGKSQTRYEVVADRFEILSTPEEGAVAPEAAEVPMGEEAATGAEVTPAGEPAAPAIPPAEAAADFALEAEAAGPVLAPELRPVEAAPDPGELAESEPARLLARRHMRPAGRATSEAAVAAGATA